MPLRQSAPICIVFAVRSRLTTTLELGKIETSVRIRVTGYDVYNRFRFAPLFRQTTINKCQCRQFQYPSPRYWGGAGGGTFAKPAPCKPTTNLPTPEAGGEEQAKRSGGVGLNETE